MKYPHPWKTDSLICSLITYLLKTTFLSLVFPILYSYPFTKINKKEKVFACKEVSYFHKRETHTQVKKLFYSKDICFENKKGTFLKFPRVLGIPKMDFFL